MLLSVPSGAVLTVEPPQLRAVLMTGGTDAALVDAVWAHPMDSDDLTHGDRMFLASWCVRELAKDAEAASLAAVCERFGESPSVRLRITDPVLALDCDCYMSGALSKARRKAQKRAARKARRREAVPGGSHFTTGGSE